MITPPLPSGTMKPSCFSAVIPVIGWNQWVKWVAPCSVAQSLRAAATVSAMSGGRDSPCIIVRFRDLYTSLGSLLCMTLSLNTREPNMEGTSFITNSLL